MRNECPRKKKGNTKQQFAKEEIQVANSMTYEKFTFFRKQREGKEATTCTYESNRTAVKNGSFPTPGKARTVLCGGKGHAPHARLSRAAPHGAVLGASSPPRNCRGSKTTAATEQQQPLQCRLLHAGAGEVLLTC